MLPAAPVSDDPWWAVIGEQLDTRASRGMLRRRQVVDGPQGPRLRINGQEFLSFCSNDYLGLANHPRLRRALAEAAQSYGAGSGASHLVSGHSRPHQQLEEALAEFVGRPRALLFSTGYMANVGTVNALVSRGDAVFADRLVHASLIDGALMSRATFKRYRHLDVEHLERLLSRSGARRKLVITDGVFSMDGDVAPLPELSAVCAGDGAWLMVDDAHGIGVMGQDGAGCLSHFGLGAREVPVLVGTLGKALGSFGAFVAGEAALVETLIQEARPYIYTTALPPGVAAASLAALRLVSEEPWRRQRLEALIRRFRSGAAALGLKLGSATTPVQPLVLGPAEAALAASRALSSRGIHVVAIRPPTVPEGRSCLRFTFSAGHHEDDVDRLIDALQQVVTARPRLFAGGRG